MWPNSSQPDNWITSYTGHFLLEAERKGFSIPQGAKQKWIGYQKKRAGEWHLDAKFKYTATDQAYRLFTLALAGQPDKAAMNRLRESKGIPQLSRWLLAATYATTGRPEVAGDLLDLRIKSTEPEYQNYYYGSDIRDQAIILYTLVLLKNDEQALPVLKELCENFNKDQWYSTQSVAWGLFAYMKWIEMIPGDQNTTSEVIVNINGEKLEQTIIPNKVWSKNIEVKKENNSLTVENKSDKPLYATLTRKGIPLASDFVREEKGISMNINYTDMKLKPVDQKNLEQGSDFMMVVKVFNNTFSAADNIALTQMVASGWEIRNSRLYEADFGIKEGEFDYRDIRDDRICTYFSLDRGETKTFIMMLNAAYKGFYYQPSVWCEAMYNRGIYSRQPGYEVKVTGTKFE
jgi:uncharacterized protein YfaS (alpha-2-macroglobulin family)